MRSTNDITIEKSYIASPKNGDPFLPVAAPMPEEGETIGTLSIPKLKQNFAIFHGDNETILRKGIGHVKGTALPGEESNSVLAGHRDTFFRKLEQLEQGDKVIVHRSGTNYLYKIKKIRIVDKDDRTVIVPKPRSTLTLTTCYPFSFIGPAPQRYIIEAELITKPQKGTS
ncbi:class D sortase [Bacillus sp. SA1-12]|uniref:class D sortase n=1 Tax=Bacillus sp. SA1-12 TaxID=1455638 RepID=UPI000696720B|nr:class D sortase [Bacillus sp. SA1-12]